MVLLRVLISTLHVHCLCCLHEQHTGRPKAVHNIQTDFVPLSEMSVYAKKVPE